MEDGLIKRFGDAAIDAGPFHGKTNREISFPKSDHRLEYLAHVGCVIAVAIDGKIGTIARLGMLFGVKHCCGSGRLSLGCGRHLREAFMKWFLSSRFFSGRAAIGLWWQRGKTLWPCRSDAEYTNPDPNKGHRFGRVDRRLAMSGVVAIDETRVVERGVAQKRPFESRQFVPG
jgi:hypothetical protein